MENLLSYYDEAITKLNISILNPKITVFYIFIYKKRLVCVACGRMYKKGMKLLKRMQNYLFEKEQ